MQLRKLKSKDAPFMLEWMQDPKITQFFAFDVSNTTYEKAIDFIENSFTKDNIHLACVDDTDEYLGTISLKNIDKTTKDAEYAVAFRAKTHGTGCAYFATTEILKYAFNELSLSTVYLNVLSKNTRAISFYNKFGFKKTNDYNRVTYENKKLEWYLINKERFNNG